MKIPQELQLNKYLLYTGNHDDLGIYDYINFFKKTFGKKMSISKKYSHNYNKVIVIENFSNVIEIIKLFFFLKKFKGKVICVITEFIRKNDNFLTFNNFENSFLKKILIKSKFIFFFSVIIFYILFFLFSTFSKIVSLGPSFQLSKIHFFRKSIHFFRKSRLWLLNIISSETNFILFHKRYLIFNLFIKKFDIFLFSHKLIDADSNIIKNNKKFLINWSSDTRKLDLSKKNFVISFSGAPNNYRSEIIKNLSYNKNLFKLKVNEEDLHKSFIKSDQDVKDLIFSIHPKKSKQWKHTSPTRYINSLEKGEVPIIVDNFDNTENYYKKFALDKKILNLENKKDLINQLRKFIDKINQDSFKNKKNIIRHDKFIDSKKKIKI